MTWTTFSGSYTANGNAHDLFDGENIDIVPGASITSINAYAVHGLYSNESVIVEGSVQGYDAIGVGLDSNDVNVYVEVTETGQVSADLLGVYTGASTVAIVNEGKITGYFGIDIGANQPFGTSSIVNSGSIIGQETAVYLADSSQEIDLTNSGVITGSFSAIQGSNGVDKIINTGKITGDIHLNLRDDFYDGRNGTTVGTVYGDSGNDTIYGGREANTLDGGVGADYLNGGDGDDILIGGSGADTLVGGTGTNTASYSTATAGVNVYMTQTQSNTGDAAGDTFSSIQNLTGSDYADKLSGDANANGIKGGAGSDFLYGGGGADKLVGGLGADLFIYKSISESTVSAYDTIKDFSESQKDRIDLSGIDANSKTAANDAFTFVGTNAFTGVAGQLRYQTSGGVTDIYADTNGDKVADFHIHLANALALKTTDFNL